MTNNDIQNAYMGVSAVTKICLGEDVVWPTTPPVYSAMPLTFEIISAGTLYWEAAQSSNTKTIQYSKNGGDWTSITSSKTKRPSIPVSAGDKVEFRGDNAAYSLSGILDANYFSADDVIFTIEGNIMSMIDSTGYTTALTLYSSNTFVSLFRSNGLLSAENLILPATGLTTNCYKNMLGGSSAMTTGPVLPAPVLVEGCYSGLFQNCTSLTYIKCLARNYNSDATISWVNGVSPTGTFVKHPNATWPSGNRGIPTNWTVEDAVI